MKFNEFIAHLGNTKGKDLTLKEHLRNTADLASKFAKTFDNSESAWYMGLLHDLGKYHPDYQKYIKNPNLDPPPLYSDFPAYYAKVKGFEKLVKPISCCNGNLNKEDDIDYIIENIAKEKDYYSEAIPWAQEEVSQINNITKEAQANLYDSILSEIKNIEEDELRVRMLSSCIIDADLLDIESNYEMEYPLTGFDKPTNFKELLKIFLSNQENLRIKNKSPLSILRDKMFKLSIESSKGPKGFYLLSGPSGSGKTRSAIAFALNHCSINNMSRIIYSSSFKSTIDQIAWELKDIFNEDMISECQSFVSLEGDNNTEELKIASDNWDSPFIVTSGINLFKSIFSSKDTIIRKIHNITDSVLILDEIQTIPKLILKPIIKVLENLVSKYNVTVLLLTSVPETLENSLWFKELKNITNITPPYNKKFKDIKNIEYSIIDENLNHDKVIDNIFKKKQSLCIVNSTKDIIELNYKIKKRDIPFDSLFYLTRLMCSAHRKDIIDKVSKKIDNGENCYLITDVIMESGVDLDFPFVLKYLAPLDSIALAAGRCNRHGKIKNGKVSIFMSEYDRYSMFSNEDEYILTKTFIKSNNNNLQKCESYEEYYSKLNNYCKISSNLKDKDEFFEVSRDLYNFEGEMLPIIVPYRPLLGEINSNINLLKNYLYNKRKILRKLQPLMVNFEKEIIYKLRAEGLVFSILKGLYLWKGIYSESLGITNKTVLSQL